MFMTFSPQHVRRRPCVAQVPQHSRCYFNEHDVLSNLDEMLAPLGIYASAIQEYNKNSTHPQRCPLKRKEKEVLAKEEETAPVEKKMLFEVKIDVEGYKPSELDVKLVGNCLTINGNHEEVDEHGMVQNSCQFTRRFTIPEDVLLDGLTCNLNSQSNTIVISAPLKVKESKEMSIPINLTGIPHPLESSGTKEKKSEVDESQEVLEEKHANLEPTSAA